MILTAFGAAREVTGSKHLLDTGHSRILLDCGVFQGHREQARAKNEVLPFDARAISACVNSHGHLDHCGSYPLLVKQEFKGTILSTDATVEVARLVMMDSARIQVSDARYLEKRQRKEPRADRKVVLPIYDESDAQTAAARFRGTKYHTPVGVSSDVTVTLHDAGHILGSSIVRLDVAGEGGRETVVFTGDLGRVNMPILRDPEALGGADWLVCESTYGNRVHDDIAFAEDELAEVIRETAAKGGRVIIPAFAIGRTQELVYHLHRLYNDGKIPNIPVFVDSPMAVSATDIFKRHPECYDIETVRDFLDRDDLPFTFPTLKYITDVEDSKRLNGMRMPCVIVSASGMCEGGRVLHHLLNGVGDSRNTILIVGFMAENTLGRALADKKPEVRIFGDTYWVKARVKIMNAFSAHADRVELGQWIKAADLSRLKGVFLVHGEPKAQDQLKADLLGLGIRRVEALEMAKPVVLA